MTKKVVCLLARQHGLSGLQALLTSPRFEITLVATHRRLPKSEDSERSERPDFFEYLAATSAHHIPLHTVDSKEEQQQLEEKLKQLDFDFLVAISWRRLIPIAVIKKAKAGAINLHRGRLPVYAGAEPIKQALLNGESTIAITAHILDEKIDHGPTLCTYEHPVAYQANKSLEENIERLKQELTPHFGPLLLQAMDLV